MRKRKAGLEVKERHGQTCVPGALLVRVDTIQAALSLVSPLPNLVTPLVARQLCTCLPAVCAQCEGLDDVSMTKGTTVKMT